MNCTHCSKETDNPKFCSSACSAKFNNPKRTGAKYIRYVKCSDPACDQMIERRCKTCNIHNPRMYINNGMTVAQMRTLRGTYEMRGMIRDHSRNSYWRQNPDKKCAACGYTKHVMVCHIKAIKDFDPNTPIKVINDINNLIGFCPNCHWEFDNGLFTLPI